nr:clavaminate synthase family protein [Streptomyces sp. Xyl84]
MPAAPPPSPQVADSTRRLLEDAVRRRVADGALGDTVLDHPEWSLPDDVLGALAEAVGPPDPARGHRVAGGLLAGLTGIGPTPAHWAENDPHRTAPFDVALALVAASLGSVFGWAGQQDGRLVHDILPSRGYEHLQVGASSTVPLSWHTEDGFHPERADFLLLACVRNPGDVGSRLACVRDLTLAETDLAELRRPLAAIEPDASYGAPDAAGPAPVGMATVWDGAQGRCVRYDPAYTRFLTDDQAFAAAYERLGAGFEAEGFTVPLAPGDVLVVDNDAVVHGRVAFRPRYDGTDRWLKRVLVRSSRGRPAREAHEHGYHQALVRPAPVSAHGTRADGRGGPAVPVTGDGDRGYRGRRPSAGFTGGDVPAGRRT